jgi:hypothetical protein
MKLTAETTEVEANVEGPTTIYKFHKPYPDEIQDILDKEKFAEGIDYDWLNPYALRITYRADDYVFQNELAKVRTAGTRKARLATGVNAELGRGSKVQLSYPKYALDPDSNAFHFNGKTGLVVGKENTGRINMYRVRLDKPVMIPDHGPVKSDVWSGEYLKEID